MSQRNESAPEVQSDASAATPTTEPQVSTPTTESPDGAPPPAAGLDPSALLKAFARCARSAATAALDMGRLGQEYISARMLLSEKVQREACVKALVAAWQEHSDDVVTPARVNALVRTYAAWHMLNASTGHKPGKVPLRVIREFSPLCERDVTQRAEVYRLHSVLAERAVALWTEATGKSLNGEECAAAVAELQAEYRKQLALEAARRAAENPDNTAARQSAEAAAAEAGKAAESAAKKRERADRPERRAIKDATQAPKPVEASQGTNLLATAKQGTAKDVAGMALELVTGHDNPDAVLAELLALLDGHNCIGRLSKQAVKAARVVLARPAAPAPVSAPIQAPAASEAPASAAA
jgi:hypothetical protein